MPFSLIATMNSFQMSNCNNKVSLRMTVFLENLEDSFISSGQVTKTLIHTRENLILKGIYWFTYLKGLEANMLFQVRLQPAAEMISPMALNFFISLPCFPMSDLFSSSSRDSPTCCKQLQQLWASHHTIYNRDSTNGCPRSWESSPLPETSVVPALYNSESVMCLSLS